MAVCRPLQLQPDEKPVIETWEQTDTIVRLCKMVDRADALRNHEDLLIAAEAAIADHGVDVPFNLIAQNAGVGRATLYRHFPDREALLQALLERSLTLIEADAEGNNGPDALFHVLASYAARAHLHAALGNYWRILDPNHPAILAWRARFMATMSPVLDAAIAAGRCRADLTLVDVASLMAMLTAIATRTDNRREFSAPDRMLALALDGLRP